MNCANGALRIGRLPLCSRNIVCRRARQPSPLSAIRFLVRLSGHTAAQFLAGAIPLIPLALLDGGSTESSNPTLIAQLAYLIIGGQVVVYLGFNAALSRWPSTRVYAWTFLVPVVAVLIEAAQGSLPGPAATIGIVVVITGVAIVNHPRAEASTTTELASPPTPAEP